MPGIFYVAIGGASGAVGRYLLSLLPTKGQFPVWTFATNFAGAVLIGFLAGLLSTKPEYSQKISLFWKTGVWRFYYIFHIFSGGIYIVGKGKYSAWSGLYNRQCAYLSVWCVHGEDDVLFSALIS